MEYPRYGQTQEAVRDQVTPSQARQDAQRAQARPMADGPQPTGWVGWVVFAGITMMVLGCFQAFMGLVGVFNTDFYLVTAGDLAIPVNYTAWGWFHLIMGVVVALAGAAVMAGKTWGRAVGIFLAGLQALVNFAWFPAYPFWSAIVIAVDVLVIYALAVHGREMKAFSRNGLL
ncbi:hypothetical protein [Planomonospora sp. ID91781]|uniref:DUF7144 family membrane protein n=1 Tax=Planomonospora sp. ID91781 TaxID=2738135 RepID=UPI0018C3D2B4|nr:hypothetical protein [Planomonospora sp. ID91781]